MTQAAALNGGMSGRVRGPGFTLGALRKRLWLSLSSGGAEI